MPSQTTQDLSTHKVYSEGNELPGTMNIVSIVVDRGINKVPMARIVFKDGDAASQNFESSNKSELEPGKVLKIDAGFHNQNQTIFEGFIVRQNIKLKNGNDSLLVVECKDKCYKMTLERKSKYFIDATDSDAAETIMQNYELQKEIDSTDLTHKQLVQYNCTDWDFVLNRMELNSMVVFSENGKLKCKKPEVASSASVTASFGTDVISFDAILDASHQYETITCKAWSMADQDIAESDNERLTITESGDLSSSSLSGKVNGSSIVYTHSGKRPADELKKWATSRQTKNILSKTRGVITCKGKLEAKPLDTLELSGFGNHYNGKYFISAVRNELKDNLWETTIQFGWWPELFTQQYQIEDKAASGIIAPVQGLQIAIVTKLQDDPESEFRVQVKFPLMDKDAEGIWARIALLDAGMERGSFFLPEKDDEVIVGFINDDPRDAIILGMLHSSNKPAAFTPSDDNNEKGFVTRSKMKIVFDDDKKIINIFTPAGKQITLDEDQKVILLKDENNNKIEMSQDGITIESGKDIKLKASNDIKAEGMNVEMKGSSNFKAEGNGGAKLSSSAITEVKGSMVNIN